MVIADETILLGLGDYTPLYTVYFLYRRIDLLWIHQCERHIMNDQINDAHNTNTSTNATYNMMVYHQKCNINSFKIQKLVPVNELVHRMIIIINNQFAVNNAIWILLQDTVLNLYVSMIQPLRSSPLNLPLFTMHLIDSYTVSDSINNTLMDNNNIQAV